MIFKTFPDGSQFTEKHVAFVVVAGALGGAALYTVSSKISDARMSRWSKKHGHPWNK